MTSQEMFKAPSLKPGYWFVNVAPLGSVPKWEIQVEQPAYGVGGKIFGYPEDEFLAKQYKR